MKKVELDKSEQELFHEAATLLKQSNSYLELLIGKLRKRGCTDQAVELHKEVKMKAAEAFEGIWKWLKEIS